MNRTTLFGLVVLGLLVLAPAAGAVHQSEETHQEASTRTVTCEGQTTCSAPSAEARATVEHPSADATTPDPGCVTKETQGHDSLVPNCNVSEPEVDPAIVRTYVGVDGLDSEEGRSSDDVDTQSEEAAGSPSSGLGIDMESAVLLGALGLGASGAAAMVGVRRLLALLVAPLASRLTRSEMLENDTRRQIYEKIGDEPGINLRGLSDEVDVAWGTLLHHLKKLEDSHLVTSERYGKYRRFFKNGSTYDEAEQERLAALSTPSTARVAEYILENPGANQSEIGDAIGVTSSTILFHVKRLKEVGLVEEEREGRYVHYFPSMNAEEAERVNAA